MVPLASMKINLILTTLSALSAYGQSTGAEEVFLEQPSGAVINVSETATFKCSVINDTYTIVWFFNDVSAAFTQNVEKGVTIVRHNDTASHLEVVGHLHNHNASISCNALIVAQNTWINSQTVRLSIESLLEESSSAVKQSSKPDVGKESNALFRESVVTPTKDVGIKSYAVFSSLMIKSTPKPPDTKSLRESEEENDKLIAMYASIGGGVLFLGILVVVVVIFIALIFKRKRNVGDKLGHKESDEELQCNPVYDTVGSGIIIHKNELYELARPAKFQDNHAYDFIGLRKDQVPKKHCY